jgi:eukaryotic-like serine/threonine-protein kinase
MMLGPYEILAPIGAGGMGEVFRARDTRLGRTVAIKRCHERFSDRFHREAAAIAALNHPNICTLYDVGPDYLVLEYVEGKQIKGPLPVDLAVSYADQILDALEVAHRCGIVHRDIKPGNIMVTSAGVKLLDFGLARIRRDYEDGSCHDLTATLVTAVHTVLGTPGYMAPEQIEGREADHRADIFSFGCVFFELLTGSRPFEGKSMQSTLTATLTRETPRLTTVRPGLPARLQNVVDDCLQKDRERRWQDAHDVRLALRAAVVPTDEVSNQRFWRVTATIIVAAVIVLISVAYYATKPGNPHTEPRMLTLAAPDGGTISSATVSPDGKSIAIVAGGKLCIQALNSTGTITVSGVNEARNPFWSPDGRDIGFFAHGKLMRVSAQGGPAQVITNADGSSGAWSLPLAGPPFIVFSYSNSGLFRVPASGGAVSTVTSLEPGESRHIRPAFLPDGSLLYVVNGAPHKEGLRIARLGDEGKAVDWQVVIPGAHLFAYVHPRGERSGSILFSTSGMLFTQAFDASARKLTGQPIPLRSSEIGLSAIGDISASVDGRVALFVAGNVGYHEAVEMNREGRQIQLIAPLGLSLNLGLSPDGRKLILAQDIDNNLDLWLYDTARGTRSRFTSSPAADGVPVWSPTGTQVAFASWRSGISDIYLAPANGTGPEQLFVHTSAPKYPCDWSRDGRQLLYETETSASGWDLWLVPVSDQLTAGPPSALLTSEFNERDGRFSPDGKWVAYVSNETGREEVYVRTVAAGGTKLQVSTGGGFKPEWNRKRLGELYFVSPERDLMAASITFGASPEAGTVRKLFSAGVDNYSLGSQFALNASVSGFFVLRRPATFPGNRVVLTLEWDFAKPGIVR